MRWLIAIVTALSALACNQDPLGGPCSDKDSDIYKVMAPKDGDNFISQDPSAFLNCESFICLSSNGSKPYCTKRCAGDTECLNANGVDMECKVVTEFGALACRAPEHSLCDEAACLDTCPGSEDPTGCEQSCRDELCCQRDASTQGVTDPAMYCAAKDGEVPHDPKAEPIGG